MPRYLDELAEGLSALDNLDRAALDERAAVEADFDHHSMTGRYRVWPNSGVIQPEDSLHRVGYVGLGEEHVVVSAPSPSDALALARVGGAK